MSAPFRFQDVKKIAVLRASSLGDFIVTLPALKAIKTTYPEAEIVLLGRPWHHEYVVKGRTPVDRVVIVPVKKGIRNEPGMQEDEKALTLFFQEMKKERFDIALNFQGNGISANPFLKQMHPRYVAGLSCAQAMQPDISLDYYYYQNETIRYLEAARLIGATGYDVEPEITVLEKDVQEVSRALPEISDHPYIVINPLAADIRRTWPVENYPLVADTFVEKGFYVVFSGAPEDSHVVDDIMDNMKGHALNACGRLSLGGLSALLSKASLLIAPDTGPVHLARAVKCPTVALYWAPNLINWGPHTRSIHKPLVSWNMACPFCGIIPNDPYPFEPTDSCRHEISFVRDITVKQVIDVAENLLANIQLAKKQKTTAEVHAQDTAGEW